MSIESAIAVIDQRLKNGQNSFHELRGALDKCSTEIGVLREMLRPKPTNWFAIVMSLFGAAVAVAGALWTLHSLFSERPTRDEIQRDTATQKQTIDQIRTEQRDLRDQQIEHRTMLKTMSDTLDASNDKLDYLIQQRGTRAGGGRRTP